MSDCVFCKIARKEVSSDLVYEDEEFTAFRDIHPKAPFHVLVIPNVHIPSLLEAEQQHARIVERLLGVATKIAKNEGLNGFKLQMNVGREGGQEVPHAHLHILGRFD